MSDTRRDRMALAALLGEGFFSRLSFGLVSLALPLYARQLGLSLAMVGVLVSLSAAVTIVGKPLMGAVADRCGWRRTMLAGIGLRTAVTLLFAACWLPWHLFGIRALYGVSQSVRGPAVNALLAQAGGKKAVASVFAWYATARAVAASAGRALAGVLLAMTAGGFAPVFLVAFVLSALPLLVVWCYVEEPSHRREPARADPEPAPAGEPAAAPARVGLLPLVTLGALMNGTAEMLRGIFPIIATEYAGLSPAETGFIYLASTVVTMVAGPVFGWLSDHVNRELVLLVRSAANILSSAIYLLAPGLAGVAAARITDDMGKAAFRPAWGALMASASSHDPASRARQIGVMGVGEDVGELLGPLLAGVLLSSGGLAALMGVRIALAALTEAYAVLVTRRLHAAEHDAGHDGAPPRNDRAHTARPSAEAAISNIDARPFASGTTRGD